MLLNVPGLGPQAREKSTTGQASALHPFHSVDPGVASMTYHYYRGKALAFEYRYQLYIVAVYHPLLLVATCNGSNDHCYGILSRSVWPKEFDVVQSAQKVLVTLYCSHDSMCGGSHWIIRITMVWAWISA